MPHGLETRVGERGLALSGGERQRLSLARVFLRADAELLVLDEATSALDASSEQWLFDALESVGRGKAIVAITHRLALAGLADEVLVLDAGQIVQRGPPRALALSAGPYAALLAAAQQTGSAVRD